VGPMIEINLPSGRGHRTLIAAGERLEQLAQIPFETYTVLEDLQALCSYETGRIEALISNVGFGMPRRMLSERLGSSPGEDGSPLLSLSQGPVQLRIENASPDLLVLLARPPEFRRPIPPLALVIEGLTLSNHDEALDRLQAIANGLFLELDTAFGIPLTLRRRPPSPIRRGPPQALADEVKFPLSEYDPQPMALYWYGRGALGMPLLRFLAFYQVLEFYFPVFADQEARRRVQSVVKNPAFRPHDESHISKIMKAMNVAGRRGFGDERSQLRATIRGSINPDELREYLGQIEERKRYFHDAKRKNSPAAKPLRLEMDDGDLLEATAERIYEIRCRIVHTKDSDGERGQLLPFSSEADRMAHDIELLEMLARGALVAGSRSLQL
jgi:hypothetical protein